MGWVLVAVVAFVVLALIITPMVVRRYDQAAQARQSNPKMAADPRRASPAGVGGPRAGPAAATPVTDQGAARWVSNGPTTDNDPGREAKKPDRPAQTPGVRAAAPAPVPASAGADTLGPSATSRIPVSPRVAGPALVAPPEPLSDAAAPPPAVASAAELTHAARGGVSGLWWIPADVAVTLRLRRSSVSVPRSFFYVWDGPPGGSPEPSAIDQKLAVDDALPAPGSERGLGYWPRYDQLSPGQRRYYLEWHASGRGFVPTELGYAFLYVYNLERRALVDRRDVKAVVSEVARLRELYATSGGPVSRSWDRYTGSLLGFLIASNPTLFSADDVDALLPLGERPTSDDLEAVLSWYAQTATPLPVRVAYRVASWMPLSQHGVVVRRVGEQLRELFTHKYAGRHGPGVVVQASKRTRRLTYRPASAALQPQEVSVPSVLAAPKKLELLSDLWNECVDELKKLSGVVGRQGHSDLTAEAWEAMPDGLRADVDHPCSFAVSGLFVSRSDGSFAVTSAGEVARAAGVVAAAKMSPATARRVAQTLSYCELAVEPDPRLTGKGWDAAQPVVLFRPADDAEEDAARYLAASSMLDIGLALAAADGTVDEEETAELRRQLAATLDLGAGEQGRLDARRHLLASVGADIGPATRAIKKLPSKVRESVGRMALAMVAADGAVSPEEVKATRRVYRALELDPATVDAEVAALLPSSPALAADGGEPGPDDAPVLVAAGKPAKGGEAIPPPPAPAGGGLRLDRAAVAAIMRDTQEVARMLADAMTAAGATEVTVDASDAATEDAPKDAATRSKVQSIPAAVAPEVGIPLDRVPARFRAICEALLTRGEWPIEEATKLAAGHNVMLSGALEQLNDWAVEHYGAPAFIEEDGRVLVERDHLN